MKVLLVSEPGVDGVFRYVEALAHFLLHRGVRVHFAYSDRRAGRPLADLVAYVRAHGGAVLNLRVGPRPGPADLRALFALRALVGAVRPDVIHSHSSKAGALARLLPLLGIRTPQVYHPHAYAGMRPQPPPARWFYDTIESVLGRRGITLNVSADEHDYARRRLRLPATRTACVPNGVDCERFRPAAPGARARLRARFGLPAHALILGSLGRATVQKDPFTLYRAFARALAVEPELTLFHLGRGELDNGLDAFVRDAGLRPRIHRLAGWDAPVEFYQCLDGFILTSVYEGLSLAALEALACDLPLILSTAPGNTALLRLPLNRCWSAAPRDVPGFADAIVRWARALRSEVRPESNHRATAIAHFDLHGNLRRVLDVYGGLLFLERAGLHGFYR